MLFDDNNVDEGTYFLFFRHARRRSWIGFSSPVCQAIHHEVLDGHRLFSRVTVVDGVGWKFRPCVRDRQMGPPHRTPTAKPGYDQAVSGQSLAFRVPKAAANSSHQMLGERSWAVLASAKRGGLVGDDFAGVGGADVGPADGGDVADPGLGEVMEQPKGGRTFGEI